MLKGIKNVHVKLIKIHSAIISYTSILGSTGTEKSDLRKGAGEFVSDFWDVFNSVRIFFPESLDKEVVDYVNTVTDKGIDFMVKVEENTTNNIQDWNKIDKEVRDLWNTVLSSIRIQFRYILGVEKEN